MKDPVTPKEWQEAVDAAEFILGIDSARQYGLVDTDMRIDQERCEDILKRGAKLGFRPAPINELCERFLGK